MIRDLALRNRTCRRFQQNESVTMRTLLKLVDLARLSPSGGNMQPLKYILSCDREKNAMIFPHLAWAAYLKDWNGPAEGERPSAYIIVLCDTAIRQSADCDAGIACQSILFGATELELGGCIVGSVQRDKLRKALQIPANCEIALVIALGKRKEQARIEPVKADGDIKYWRDADGVHHVPKRALEGIVLA
ncbi:MAG: nitroreductase family protein [Verrucomicrobiota bacterium]|nr:nitroreductase family protein [Verrucomicrobiota bacterium]